MVEESPVAIVTGGDGDIGGLLVKLLLEKKFRVASLDCSRNDRIAARYDAFGDSYRFLQVNIRLREAVEGAVRDIFTSWGRIDCLVNCAGIFHPRAFVDLTEEDWDDTIGVNLDGTFWACQAVAPHMISSGSGGRIINMSSGLAFKGGPGMGHYAASKAGVEGLTHTLALDLAPYKINVNAVAPGMVVGSMARNALGERGLEKAAADNPSKRLAVPDDIAEVIGFLLGPESSFITGQIIHVNGGGLMI